MQIFHRNDFRFAEKQFGSLSMYELGIVLPPCTHGHLCISNGLMHCFPAEDAGEVQPLHAHQPFSGISNIGWDLCSSPRSSAFEAEQAR